MVHETSSTQVQTPQTTPNNLSSWLLSLPADPQALAREYIGQTLHSLAGSLVRLSLLCNSRTAPSTAQLTRHLGGLLESTAAAEEELAAARVKLLEETSAGAADRTTDKTGRAVLEAPLEELLGSGAQMNDVLAAVLSTFSELMDNGRPVDVNLVIRDKQSYEGGMFGGRKEGVGKLTFANGDIYLGHWSRGLREGQGEYLWKSGAKYKGQYVRNMREGRGTFKFPDDSTYEGEWKNGTRHGKGMMVWDNGDRYEGDFVNSNRTGKGTFTR